MKQIIPFKKDLPFKTKVSDITSISLERKIEILDGGIVTGTFYITGDYKMNEGSINREEFSFDLPFDITLDPRYDVNSVKADIEDFYYDVINEDTLKVNIDLYIEAEYLPDTSLDNNILTEEDKSDNEMNDVQKEMQKVIPTDFDSDFNVSTNKSNSSANSISSINLNQNILEKLNSILYFLQDYIPPLQSRQLCLDTGVLVGELTLPINK